MTISQLITLLMNLEKQSGPDASVFIDTNPFTGEILTADIDVHMPDGEQIVIIYGA